MLDFGVRKQKRVCRSTFSAEINALSDSLEHGKTLQLALHQIERGISPASELLVLQTNGQLAITLMASIDAKSVFEAVRSKDAGTLPFEESLILQVLAIREDLQHARLFCLWWIDTRDVLADGLNKRRLGQTAITTCMLRR